MSHYFIAQLQQVYWTVNPYSDATIWSKGLGKVWSRAMGVLCGLHLAGVASQGSASRLSLQVLLTSPAAATPLPLGPLRGAEGGHRSALDSAKKPDVGLGWAKRSLLQVEIKVILA